MAEPEKQQMGDGSDNFGQAAGQMAKAAGGPWGAVLSAAWSMRHSLFKVLICICLALLILITMVVSLPSIVSNSIFGLDGTKPAEGATLQGKYDELAEAVSAVVDDAYD